MSSEEERDYTPGTDAMSLRLLKTRTILLSGTVDQEMAERVITQLMLLEAESHEPIRLMITTPGGAIYPGYAIYDMIRYVESPVIAIGAGYVASMGVPIILAAAKENRLALPNTRFMLHQPAGGAIGQLQDIRIQAQEIIQIRERINELIAQETGQSVDKVKKDSDRDFWMSAEEALEYGIIARIVENARDIDAG
ncbi:MAG: ATP-dependent Clp protease proteolytic subunit [Candidatus Hydrogenedentes bacterium]|nr:ATP-dependent Clp protease proteolytic subunit [Candidatus Hydrogenedentota bacterium]